MKYLILFLSFFSCSKSEYSELFLNKQSDTQTFSTQSEIQINSEIDIIIAFWWPKEFEKQESELVEDIIKISRNISQVQKDYTSNSFQKTCEYKKIDCLCHLEFICEDDILMNDEKFDQCLTLDKSLNTLNENYDISDKLKTIQENLNLFSKKGEWIKNFLDFQTEKTPYFNSKTLEILIPHWEEEEFTLDNTNLKDLKYQKNQLSFNFIKDNKKVLARLDLTEFEFTFSAMGTLKEFKGTKLIREGIIFFEFSKEKACL